MEFPGFRSTCNLVGTETFHQVCSVEQFSHVSFCTIVFFLKQPPVHIQFLNHSSTFLSVPTTRWASSSWTHGVENPSASTNSSPTHCRCRILCIAMTIKDGQRWRRKETHRISVLGFRAEFLCWPPKFLRKRCEVG